MYIFSFFTANIKEVRPFASGVSFNLGTGSIIRNL